jgi:hypothetical protein
MRHHVSLTKKTFIRETYFFYLSYELIFHKQIFLFHMKKWFYKQDFYQALALKIIHARLFIENSCIKNTYSVEKWQIDIMEVDWKHAQKKY